MLDSIQKFYPGIAVIIADDSPDVYQTKIDATKYPDAYQYIMPEFTGWFAGRALVISQVKTDYFLWVDDDFIFSEETDLEYMLNMLEKTGKYWK